MQNAAAETISHQVASLQIIFLTSILLLYRDKGEYLVVFFFSGSLHDLCLTVLITRNLGIVAASFRKDASP